MSNENTPLVSSSSTTASTTLNRRRNMFWTLGCIYGATAVCFGAFGAHGLKKKITDPARIANFSTAAHYQLIHSVALLIASQAAPENTLAGGLLTAGMTMFSGSIYALVLDPARFRFLGPVTPLGGLCLIGGWAALAFK
ncbi:Uu.00g031520.m01.CDS01 [Anthostomella pinea]|uniref:Uu.00g031520.m01.CDS01 n=1 Tax=Anthostomella pinea TaxID=933095 RepID=A0AAI8V8H9_9PEZI|nr:Uu.00g031520.m01.CDS01 [Anthostomella pinea]